MKSFFLQAVDLVKHMFFHHNVKILPFIGTNNISFPFITSAGIVAGESVAEIDDFCGGAGFAPGGHN